MKINHSIFIIIILLVPVISFSQATPDINYVYIDGTSIGVGTYKTHTVEMASLSEITLKLKVECDNSSVTAGSNSGAWVTVTLDNFTSSGYMNCCYWAGNYDDELNYTEWYGTVWSGHPDPYLNSCVAEFELIQGETWSRYWSKSMEVKFVPQSYGTFILFYRAAMSENNGTIRDPSSSPYVDAFGYPANKIVLTITQPNSPPSTPSNPDPYDYETNVSINENLDWSNCTDPDGDDVDYEVYFGKDSSPDNGEYQGTTSSSSYSLSTLDYDEHYYWKIIAIDGNGGETEGPVWDFTTEEENLQPDFDIIASSATPATINVVNGVPDSDVEWECSVKNIGDTRAVIAPLGVYMSTSSNSLGTKVAETEIASTTYQGWGLNNGYTDTDEGDFSIPTSLIPTTSGQHTRYIHFFADYNNTEDNEISETNNKDFKTITLNINSTPSTPSNPDPYNGESNVSINTNLDWSDCTDPDGDNVQYEVFFGEDSSPDNTEYQGTVSSSDYTLTTLDYDEHYYWKIIAIDGNGGETEGPVWDFTTEEENLQPDFDIIASSATPATINVVNGVPDSDVEWECSVKNIGDARAVIAPLGVYISTSSSNLGTKVDETNIASTLIQGLAAGNTDTDNGSFSIPSSLIPTSAGQHTRYIHFFADWNNTEDNEKLETNNKDFQTITLDFIVPNYNVNFIIIDSRTNQYFPDNVRLKIYDSPTNWNTVIFNELSVENVSLDWFGAPQGIHPWEMINENVSGTHEYWGTGEINITGVESFNMPRLAPYENSSHLPYPTSQDATNLSQNYYSTNNPASAGQTVYIPVRVYNGQSYSKQVKATIYINENQIYSNNNGVLTETISGNSSHTFVFPYTISNNTTDGTTLYINSEIEAEYNSSFSLTDSYNNWESFSVDAATLPKISSTNPDNNQVNVSANDLIWVYFNKEMNSNTVENANNFIVETSGSTITGTIDYQYLDTDNNWATFTPSSGLITGTQYDVTLTTGMTDLVGNPLDGNSNNIADGSPTDNFTFSFTTDNSSIYTKEWTDIEGNESDYSIKVNLRSNINISGEPLTDYCDTDDIVDIGVFSTINNQQVLVNEIAKAMSILALGANKVVLNTIQYYPDRTASIPNTNIQSSLGVYDNDNNLYAINSLIELNGSDLSKIRNTSYWNTEGTDYYERRYEMYSEVLRSLVYFLDEEQILSYYGYYSPLLNKIDNILAVTDFTVAQPLSEISNIMQHNMKLMNAQQIINSNNSVLTVHALDNFMNKVGLITNIIKSANTISHNRKKALIEYMFMTEITGQKIEAIHEAISQSTGAFNDIALVNAIKDIRYDYYNNYNAYDNGDWKLLADYIASDMQEAELNTIIDLSLIWGEYAATYFFGIKAYLLIAPWKAGFALWNSRDDIRCSIFATNIHEILTNSIENQIYAGYSEYDELLSYGIANNLRYISSYMAYNYVLEYLNSPLVVVGSWLHGYSLNEAREYYQERSDIALNYLNYSGGPWYFAGIEGDIYDHRCLTGKLSVTNFAIEEISAPTLTSNNEEINLSETVELSALNAASNFGNPLEYRFEFGDGNNSNWGDATYDYTYQNSGTFTIKVKARSVLNPDIVSEYSNDLVVIVIEEEVVSNPNTPITPDVINTDEVFTASVSGSVSNIGSDIEYQLFWGDGSYSEWGASGMQHSYDTPDVYNVFARGRSVTNTNSISGWSDPKQIEVPSPIQPTLIIENVTITNNQTQCYDAVNSITVAGSGTVVDINSGGEATYIAAGSIFLKDGFHSHNGSQSHAFITLSGDFCSQQQSMVAVVPDELLDNEGSITKDVVADDDSNLLDIKVYPNPTTGEFVIDFSGKQVNADITLLDFYGSIVHSTLVHEQSIKKIDITTLPGGLYIIVINNNSEKIFKKIVKTF